MNIDLEKLEEYKNSFLRVFPAGERFDQALYLERERNYKQELCDIFQKEFLPSLKQLPENKEELLTLAEGLLRLFFRPIKAMNGKPQNLVGWRYVSFARKIDDTNKMEFAVEVERLIDESKPIEDRITRFYTALERIAGSIGDKATPAMKRAIATFFLFQSDPEKHVFIKTREFGRAVKDLSGQSFYGQPNEYSKLLELAIAVRDELRARGWKPIDLIDIQSFLWVHQSYGGEDMPVGPTDDVAFEDVVRTDSALNQILYGPPGTGKTYHTINKALAILDPDFLARNTDNRMALKTRFDELRERGRVGFVTFHQSFSYEDFVEGLRASTNENEQVFYEIDDGVFKRMCEAAGAVVTVGSLEAIDVADRQIWKMSLGSTQKPNDDVFEDGIEENRILLGYGGNVDFAGVTNRAEITERFNQSGESKDDKDYAVTAVNTFINKMQVGDLVVVSDGNHKFRAIGEITGQYEIVDDSDRDAYFQARPVKWLRVYSPSLPCEQLMNNVFSQMTIYRLRPGSVNMEKLQSLLDVSEEAMEKQPFVLIIDEINRGNIANILGELITLIEPSKRLGQPESLQVKLPYSKELFGVPDNLFIIGTMNTADRSLTHIDTALRRRFEFESMLPDINVLRDMGIELVEGINVPRMLSVMNRRIELLYDREHTLGHSFFIPLAENSSLETLERIFRTSVFPLLEEYFFEDWSRIRQVLADNQKQNKDLMFYVPSYTDSDIERLLGDESPGNLSEKIFRRNYEALRTAEAYIGIYEKPVIQPQD